jgi:hypothetical protein
VILLLAGSWRRKAYFALVLLPTAFFPSPCAAQLYGRFSLSKAAYLAGEPVFLSFTVKNAGDQPIEILTADPMTFCSGYRLEVAGAQDRWMSSCSGGAPGGSCASSGVVLTPGESRTDRILMNARFDLKRPGTYSLRVTHRLEYGPTGASSSALLPGSSTQDFQSQQQILIQPARVDELQAEFAQYARDLDSADFQARLEAAKVIAYLAPQFMEPAILKILHTQGLQNYGVEGLRNLGTPSAHQALTKFVEDSPPTDVMGPYQHALLFLGETGSKGDIPLLIKVAHANAPDSLSRMLAIHSAGMAGGAAAVPALTAELDDPSINTRQAAVRALYLTGSRVAVPVLIGLLQSPEWRVSGTAEYGLEVLTHRSGATTDSMKPPPPGTQAKWTRWWREYGQTAIIFNTNQCGKLTPLPSP